MAKVVSTNKEYRAITAELRAKMMDGKPGMIEGYAAVFNTETDLGFFREKIAKGAFTRALNEKQDVRMLFNHDPNIVLGRTTSGTLRLSEDNTGLRFEVDMPDTMMGMDVYKMIERGDVSQCSFGFRVNEENVSYDSEGNATREIRDADLFDTSVCTYPAYEQTSVEARSVAETHTKLDEEKAKSEEPKAPVFDVERAKRRTRLAEISLN